MANKKVIIDDFRLKELDNLMRIANDMIKNNNTKNLPKLLKKAKKYTKQALENTTDENSGLHVVANGKL